MSLEAQIYTCQQYAKSKDMIVIMAGIEAQSAKNTDRPELQSIMNLIAQKKIHHLLVVKLDRLSRDTEDAIRMGKQCAENGVTLHLITEGGQVDLTDPAQEMMFTMRAAMATFERKRISENTKLAMKLKKEKGERISIQAPFGFRFENDMVVPDEGELKTIAHVKQLHDNGMSLRKIAERIKREGYVNRKGKPYAHNAILRLLRAA